MSTNDELRTCRRQNLTFKIFVGRVESGAGNLQSPILTSYRDCSIFSPKKGEVTGGWIKLHNEEFHNLHSLYTVGVINMKTKWAAHVSCLGGGETHILCRSRNLKEKTTWKA